MIQTLQAVRAVAALAVVLFHASVVMALPKYFGAAPLGGAFGPGHTGVYLFFVLSGFIIAYAHAKDLGRPARMGRYVWNRATRIYPVYWLVAAGALVLEVLVNGVLSPRMGEPAYIFGIVTLLPIVGAEGNLAVAWTLFHEVFFYLVFAVAILNTRMGAVAMAVWLALSGASAWFGTPTSPALAVVVSPLNLLFGFGVAVWVLYDRVVIPRPALVAALGAVGFAGLWVSEIVRPGAPVSVGSTLAYGAASAAILLGLTAGEKRYGWRVPGFLLDLGAASYAIYLAHFIVVSAAAKAAMPLRFVPSEILFLAIVMAGIAGGLLLHVLVERPLLRLLRMRARAAQPTEPTPTVPVVSPAP